MKAKRIFSCFFSLLILSLMGQQKQDSVETRWKYTPNFLVGIDILGAGTSFFSDRKVFQGSVTSRVVENWYAVLDAGFEKNRYDRNGYDADASGPFGKIGVLYMLAHDAENPLNGFYGGGKLAASFYQQEYRQVPIRGYGETEFFQSFPESRQSSYWLEAAVGGRVQLFESPFYIDVSVQPRYLLFSTTQEEIKPMIVPGFGKSASKFAVGFTWSLAYSFK